MTSGGGLGTGSWGSLGIRLLRGSRLLNATPRDRALFLEDWRDARRAEEAFSKRGEGKSKKTWNENQSGWKRNPNFFLPPIRTFQRLRSRIQERATLSALARPFNIVSKLNT